MRGGSRNVQKKGSGAVWKNLLRPWEEMLSNDGYDCKPNHVPDIPIPPRIQAHNEHEERRSQEEAQNPVIMIMESGGKPAGEDALLFFGLDKGLPIHRIIQVWYSRFRYLKIVRIVRHP